MRTSVTEKKLLNEAIETFGNTTGIRLEVKAVGQGIKNDTIANAVINLNYNGLVNGYIAGIKKGLTTQTIGLVLNQIINLIRDPLIITDYVNPNMADKLRKMNVSFVDKIGNAYLNEPPIYIFIKGNRPLDNVDKKTVNRALAYPGRAFQTAGLRVLFLLLCNPEYVKKPYRDIAKAADVALGTVGWVLTDLGLQGFLMIARKRKKILINEKELVLKWVEAYPVNLRPKLIVGNYKADISDWWKHVDIKKYNAMWGGEIAAAQSKRHLRPEKVTIYIKDDPTKLCTENKLKKDPNGDIEILNVFWNIELNNDFVPPLLVYADLLATGDARNIETARIVYEERLDRLIQ
ncbi:MAG: type IV toxin-antitoxin system AbiEi family antitoxin [Thermodesulfobacteriota bacterium]